MKAKPQIFLSLLAIPLFCIALQASAAPMTPITNIVTNGGFETGDFTGWTQSGDTGFTGVSTGIANSGDYAGFFGPVGDLGYLSQNLNTVAGMSYDLSFFLLNSGAGGGETPGQAQSMPPVRPGGGPVMEEFQVFWNGVLIYSIPPNSDPSVYTQISFSGLIATGATTELKFGFRNDPAFWFLDDVTAGASGVPETLSTIWLALPVGMFALLRLRRKTA